MVGVYGRLPKYVNELVILLALFLCRLLTLHSYPTVRINARARPAIRCSWKVRMPCR